jgi:hypothetical protein
MRAEVSDLIDNILLIISTHTNDQAHRKNHLKPDPGAETGLFE